jgi:hypothetical protein
MSDFIHKASKAQWIHDIFYPATAWFGILIKVAK